MDRSEFLNWMQRIMERFDLLETLTTSNRTSNSQQTQEVLLDNQDLLLMLKVSARSLQRYRSKGILPYYCISGKIYYKQSDVERIIKEGYVRCVQKHKLKK